MVYIDNYGYVKCDYNSYCPAEFGSYCMDCPLLKINKRNH